MEQVAPFGSSPGNVTSHHTPREAEPLFSSGCLQLHDFELSALTFIFSIVYMTCNISFESLCLLVVLYSLLQGPPLKITPVLFTISLSSDDVKNRVSCRLKFSEESRCAIYLNFFQSCELLTVTFCSYLCIWLNLEFF